MRYYEIYNNGKLLRGMCHEAINHDSCLHPVIIVHGYFSANRIGPQRLFVKMANTISKHGFDVYRFDLSGMGESDGDISNITFSDHVDDVKKIVEFVQTKHYNNKVCVIAHCLGCSTVLSNVISNSSLFREVIFLAPYYTTDQVLAAFFSQESIVQLSNENHTYRKGLFAHASFFLESKESVFVNSLNKCHVMINVIIPENDQFIPLSSSKHIFEGLPKINTMYLPGADHNFLEVNDLLISKTLEMLCDEKYTI